MNDLDVLVVRENKQTINKMSASLEAKRKAFELFGSTGNIITKVAAPAFVGSLLSPFDIEGPLVEIITGVALAAGYIMEKVSKSNLEKIEAISTNGQVSREVNLDKSDIERVANAMNHLYKGLNEKRNQRR